MAMDAVLTGGAGARTETVWLMEERGLGGGILPEGAVCAGGK